MIRGRAAIRDVHFGATEIIIHALRERESGGKYTWRKFSLKKKRLESPPGTSGVH